MIDLRFNELPYTLICDGIEYKIDTSFRTWLHFDYLLRTEKIAWSGIFIDEIPNNWVEAALEFLKSKNVTPNPKKHIHEKTLDYILDGDYIVAGFQQAYGIDLTDSNLDMHWHRFKALLSGLPEDTLLSKIMAYRGWHKSNVKHETEMQRLKEEWAFPDEDMEEKKRKALEWANNTLL